jgi:hypothetical protein
MDDDSEAMKQVMIIIKKEPAIESLVPFIHLFFQGSFPCISSGKRIFPSRISSTTNSDCWSMMDTRG